MANSATPGPARSLREESFPTRCKCGHRATAHCRKRWYGTVYEDETGNVNAEACLCRSYTVVSLFNGRLNLTPILLAYERIRRDRRAAEKVCICPSHASNRGECPIHDDKGRTRGDAH